MTKLSELSYDKRIRQKYIMFGVVLGITFMIFVGIIPIGLGGILRLTVFSQETIISLQEYIIMTILSFILFGVCILGCWWMWYTKSKMKNHPELEEIGLKWDYEKVV